MQNLRCGGLFFALIVGCGLLSLTHSAGAQCRQSLPSQLEAQLVQAGQRLRPPESLRCPRDHLTAFNGRVLFFHRGHTRTVIQLHTDAQTTEELTLHHPEGADLIQWFLLRAKEFQSEDWALIESAHNHLWANMRAIVWVCDDGSNPVIDWRPPETNQPTPPR